MPLTHSGLRSSIDFGLYASEVGTMPFVMEYSDLYAGISNNIDEDPFVKITSFPPKALKVKNPLSYWMA